MSDQNNNLERQEDNYLACRHYAAQTDADENRIARFTHDNGEHYFVWLSRKGDVMMRSEGYPTVAARDNGAASVVKNRELEERYSVVEIAGRWFVFLKAGNHQEIARSCPYDSEEAARNAFPVFNPDADQPEPEPAVEAVAAAKSSDRSEDEYLVCSRYRDHEADEHRMAKFTHENGNHYFVWYSRKGEVMMRSESYPTTGARDNGYESVLKNRELPERFKVEEVNGIWFVVLKAGNHQEIARSCPFKSEDEARSYYPAFNPDADQPEPEPVVEAAAPAARESERRDDNYLACAHYRGDTAGTADENGIIKFKHGEEYFFSWVNKDGEVLLRSEGYPTTGARDNGANSVIKNRDLQERYSYLEVAGRWFVILKAGNHQEIGRSCPYASEAIARANYMAPVEAARMVEPVVVASVDKEDDYLPCADYRGNIAGDSGIAIFTHSNGQKYFVWYDEDGSVLLRSEGFPSDSELEEELDLVMQYREDESRYSIIEKGGYKMAILKTPEGREIGRSCLERVDVAAPVEVAPIVAAAAVAAVVETPKAVEPVDVEDDYLACQEYRGHGSVDANGISRFTHANGQMYFVWYDDKGNVLLRSEGFRNDADLQQELDLVMKYRDDKSRFSIIEKAGLKMRVLKTPEGREIGRSCLEKEVTPLPLAAVAAVAAVAAAPKVVAPKDKEDDYVACEEYRNRGKADNKGIVRFRHNNGKKYFVWYDDKGEVLLRSEGFTTNADLERELNALLRRRNKEENYEIIERNGYRMRILKDERGREIGRSCLEKIVAAAPVVAPVVAAAAAAAVVAPKMEAPKPKVVAEKVVEAEAAGFNWWPWLLGALLLLGLLFFLLRGCDGCKKPEAAVVVPTVDTVAAAPAAPVAPVGCDCTNGSDPVFRLPAAGTPAKSLHRLGTNPEFGNSHGLTGAQFYDKISKKAAANAGDKDFLDRMFKAMGYANGFADAKPEMFTEVELKPGTVGNMGHAKTHETTYSSLDTKGKDLLAFHIKSANGCDLHFMKTCGNHFFFCSK